MCKITDINVLICSKENSYARSIRNTVFQIGANVFIADSDNLVRSIGQQYPIDIALIDIDFNGSGGFDTGDLLVTYNPNMFFLIFSKKENLLDPIRTILSNATDFIFQGSKKKRKEKISLWIDVAMKARDVRSFVNA